MDGVMKKMRLNFMSNVPIYFSSLSPMPFNSIEKIDSCLHGVS
jgi:hypothetical protein